MELVEAVKNARSVDELREWYKARLNRYGGKPSDNATAVIIQVHPQKSQARLSVVSPKSMAVTDTLHDPYAGLLSVRPRFQKK
jgi:hypothetical protein